MAEKIRLQGRSLLVGAVPLSYLTFAVGAMLILSLSLLPLAYKSGVAPYLQGYLGEETKYFNLAFALILIVSGHMLYTALKIGSDRYMLKKAQNIHADTKDIFFYFRPKSFIGLLWLSLKLNLLKALIFLSFNVPTLICLSLIVNLSKSAFSAAVTLVLGAGCAAFLINAIRYYFKVTASLFLVKYYFIKGEYLNFRHLISSSQKAMKGKCSELLRLKNSFIGWFVSCTFILPAGYVWGYYNQTLAAYAAEIIKLQ